MTKVHVNQETGKMGRCIAPDGSCPLGSNGRHFTDQKLAQRNSEEVLAKSYGNVATASKKKVVYVTVDRVDVNEDFPHPQANRLDKVSTTVDAVFNGATSSSAISQALDVVDRQGAYYGDAAGYLGLVDVTNDQELKEYRLTERGERFIDEDAAGREEIIRETINNMPLMQVYREEGEEAAMKFIQDTQDVGDTTASRRLATLKTWDETLKTSITDSIEIDRLESEGRFVEASKYAEEQRKKRLEAQKPKTEARGVVCNTCFMEMPLSGICSNCDY